ncbi:protein FAM221A [Protopterus annectens]|uniref:protein FAM221A n=1 Tax=Protopterus annectens TaxID=7888 RepID=UPI001CF98F37|nr:protein FAM221A [Protopterus annectens]
MEKITISKEMAAAVDSYLQYRRIVGEDDGGKLFTPEEYEQYKKKMLPIRQKNRLFVSWTSPTGMDCKLVGPETQCFCTHRYKQHKTDFEDIPKERPIFLPCRVKGCQCKTYLYVPLNGSQPIRCRCKHFADEHHEAEHYSCKKCSSCTEFRSSFTCGCGHPTFTHDTVVETKEERMARGNPVGYDVPYAAMGGLTGFSSLAEGYLRLDPSGTGAPAVDILNAPVNSMDHPYLKTYGGHHDRQALTNGLCSMTEQLSHLKTSEEKDMKYFEHCYQERLKMERIAKRQKQHSKAKSKTK